MTSTPPTRRAGRGAARGRRAIRTRAASRRGKPVATRAAAAIPTSARRRAAAASTATTGTNRPARRAVRSIPVLRAVRVLRARLGAARRRQSAANADERRQPDAPPDLAGPLPRVGPPDEPEASSARTPRSDRGQTAGRRTARPNPGSTTSRSSRPSSGSQRATGSPGAARTPASPGPSSPVAPRRSRIRPAAPARLAPAPRGRTHRR